MSSSDDSFTSNSSPMFEPFQKNNDREQFLKGLNWIKSDFVEITNENVFVKLSGFLINGIGAFAKTNFKKGQVVLYYVACEVFGDEKAHPEYAKAINNDDYIFEIPFDTTNESSSKLFISPLGPYNKSGSMFDKQTLKEPPFCKAAFLNDTHGTDLKENVEVEQLGSSITLYIVKDDDKELTNLTNLKFAMKIIATRDIEIGEELFLGYGQDYWKKKKLSSIEPTQSINDELKKEKLLRYYDSSPNWFAEKKSCEIIEKKGQQVQVFDSFLYNVIDNGYICNEDLLHLYTLRDELIAGFIWLSKIYLKNSYTKLYIKDLWFRIRDDNATVNTPEDLERFLISIYDHKQVCLNLASVTSDQTELKTYSLAKFMKGVLATKVPQTWSTTLKLEAKKIKQASKVIPLKMEILKDDIIDKLREHKACMTIKTLLSNIVIVLNALQNAEIELSSGTQ